MPNRIRFTDELHPRSAVFSASSTESDTKTVGKEYYYINIINNMETEINPQHTHKLLRQ